MRQLLVALTIALAALTATPAPIVVALALR